MRILKVENIAGFPLLFLRNKLYIIRTACVCECVLASVVVVEIGL